MTTKEFIENLEYLQHGLLGQNKTAKKQFDNGIALDTIAKNVFLDIHLNDALSEIGIGISDPLSEKIYLTVNERVRVVKEYLYNLRTEGVHKLDEIELNL